MTITGVKLVKETGGATLRGGNTYERVYHVYFTDGYSTAALLANTEDSLEKVGESHPDDPSVVALTVKPELEDDSAPDAGIAVYTVTFGIVPPEGFAQDPLSRPAVITGEGGVDVTEVVHQTTDATPVGINNSSDDLYDPLPERPKRGNTTNIVRNQAGHPGGIARAYSNTLNDATFYGQDPGTCMMGKITWAKKSEVINGATVTYYEVTFPIRNCPDGWRWKLIDNGLRKKNADGTKSHITDAAGNPVTSPVLLNGSGDELAAGGTPVTFPAAGYKVLYETDWSVLGLPNPFA